MAASIHITASILMVLGTSLSLSSNRFEYSKGLEILKEHLVHDLGFSKEPNVKEAKLSDAEYEKMFDVYNEMKRQAAEVKKIRRRFKKLKHTTPTKHSFHLQEGDLSPSSLQFNLETLSEVERGWSLVRAASLQLHLRRTGRQVPGTRVSLAQTILHGEGSVVASTDTPDTSGEEVTVSLDITDTVQAWLLDPGTARGLTVEAEGWEVVREAGRAPVILVQAELSLTRQRRSLYPGLFQLEDDLDADTDSDQDCGAAASNRCCRDNMVVNLRQLEGFNFILEPTEFNAYMCRGRCPARYKPLNDHSLLQSLVHLQHQQQPASVLGAELPAARVRRPCCVPSQLASLPILHLDENNPSKLKVTTWRSIVVTECACG